MESTLKCERCYHIAENPQLFTCGHILCSLCTSQMIFFKHFTELSTHDTIHVKCICSSGNKTIQVLQIKDLLLMRNSKLLNICLKHKCEEKDYCLNCKTWICEKGAEIHREMYCDHQMKYTDIDIDFDIDNDKEKCSSHQREFIEFYCHDCNETICKLCTLKDHKHFYHKFQQITEYSQQIKAKIPLHEDISTYMNLFENISYNFQSLLQFKEDYTLNHFNQLIKQLEEAKAAYIDKMKKIAQRAEIIIILLKNVYSDFIKSMKTSHNIQILKDLTGIYSDITGLDLQEDMDSCMNKFQEAVYEYLDKLYSWRHEIKITWSSRLYPWVNTHTLTGHRDWVIALTQLKDGRVVSGSDDMTMKIWEGNNFRNSLTLSAKRSVAICVIQLDDGRIASANDDHSIKLWDINLTEPTPSLTLTGHQSPVNSLLQLKDGRIVSASADRTIKVWKINRNHFQNILTRTEHTGSVNSIIQLHDSRLASGSTDGTIIVWNERENVINHTITLTGHTDAVFALLQLKDGRVISGSADTTIKVWEVTLKHFKNTLTLAAHNGIVLSLLELKDGRVASGSEDHSIKIWEVNKRNFKNILTLIGHSSFVCSLIQLEDGRIVSGSYDKTIKVWKEC